MLNTVADAEFDHDAPTASARGRRHAAEQAGRSGAPNDIGALRIAGAGLLIAVGNL